MSKLLYPATFIGGYVFATTGLITQIVIGGLAFVGYNSYQAVKHKV